MTLRDSHSGSAWNTLSSVNLSRLKCLSDHRSYLIWRSVTIIQVLHEKPFPQLIFHVHSIQVTTEVTSFEFEDPWQSFKFFMKSPFLINLSCLQGTSDHSCYLKRVVLLPPWQREAMFFGIVGLSLCLPVCKQHYSKCYKRIAMKFYEVVWGGTMTN